MVQRQDKVSDLSGIELWLRSPARRFSLIVVATLLASAVTTFQLYELFSEFADRRFELSGRRPEFDVFRVWQHQLITWGIWGVAFEPIIWLSGFLNRFVGHWILIALLHVPLSYGAAYASVELNDVLTEALLEDVVLPRGEPGRRAEADRFRRESQDPEGQPRRVLPEERIGRRDGPGRDGPPRERGERARRRGMAAFMRSRRFRMPRDMGVYWAILALGAGVTAFLRSRVQERAAAASTLNSANLETQLARAQMDSLKSQLQPHFLFNALHTIGGLIRAKDQPGALQTLSALGGLLRQTLDLGESQRVTLSEELEIAEAYLSIEKIRFGERLVTVVDAPDEALEFRVPALILLPLVENAVRYAVEPRVEGGRVEVEIAIAKDRLRLEVRDDGPGFPTNVLAGETPEDGRAHIGLENSRRRMEMLYGTELRFELSNQADGGASVLIELPLEKGESR